MFGGFSRHFRHISISKSYEPSGELSLLKLSRGEDALQRKLKSDLYFFLIMWAPRRGAVLHEVRPYGGEEPLVVSMSSIMSVMSRESREYIFRGA